MKKLNVLITYKGKQYVYEFEDEKMTMDYNIYVLLSNKDSKNNYEMARYHYICKLYDGGLLIPDTVMEVDKSAFINIKLVNSEFEKYLYKDWRLPLHAIGCQCDTFPLDGNYSICL